MEFDAKAEPYKTSQRWSFAYVSVKERWPVIITQAIDNVFRATRSSKDATHIAEGKRIVEELAKMKYEMQHDRVMTPLKDDGEKDIQDYNKELEKLGNPKWYDAPWLFSECYMYRRMNTSFTTTTGWKNYDVFATSKEKTFRSSLPAVLELAHRLPAVIAPAPDDEAFALILDEIFEICLWGNSTDLSLLTTLTYSDIQELQGSKARQKSKTNILANDLPKIHELLLKLKKEKEDSEEDDRRIDIILDNSGFELFVDLYLALFLLSTNLATHVVLHPKSFPWFVSDVLPADFQFMLNALNDPKKFFAPPVPSSHDSLPPDPNPEFSEQDLEALGKVFEGLSNFHGEGKLTIRPHRFWTKADTFWRMPHVKDAGDLLEDLRLSELVIFKGDLNYRKLTCDSSWATTTPFSTALGPLGVDSGIRILALRTCKADVVVGLPEGTDEKMNTLENEDVRKRSWAWSGKYAVVQYSDGKTKEA